MEINKKVFRALKTNHLIDKDETFDREKLFFVTELWQYYALVNYLIEK